MVFEFGSSVCAETVAGKVPVVGLGGLQLGNAHIRHNQRESLGRRRGPHGESDRAVQHFSNSLADLAKAISCSIKRIHF